jgi:quercetin dioxygenase-like cupin family protein
MSQPTASYTTFTPPYPDGDMPPTTIRPITLTKPVEHNKGWGKEIWIVNNAKYCGKLLVFNKGARFSLHMHFSKEESFYVLNGQLLLEMINLIDGSPAERTISEGDVIHIPPGNPHRLTAITEATIIEISTTHYEEDSYRISPGDSQNKSGGKSNKSKE